MILVFASIVDENAAMLVDCLAARSAVSLMTCAELAAAPLHLCHPNFSDSVITVSGRPVGVGRLAGVVNLLPVVFPGELIFYDGAERDYQAAEFHALLTFFLSSLACPVINRATATSLTGPFHNPLGWRLLARSIGLATMPVTTRSDTFTNPFSAPANGAITAECLGSRVIASSDTEADAQVLTLARQAGVEYLRATFVRDSGQVLRCLTAHTIPDVKSALTCAAIADYFSARQS
jgi:hypothetical protein